MSLQGGEARGGQEPSNGSQSSEEELSDIGTEYQAKTLQGFFSSCLKH